VIAFVPTRTVKYSTALSIAHIPTSQSSVTAFTKVRSRT